MGPTSSTAPPRTGVPVVGDYVLLEHSCGPAADVHTAPVQVFSVTGMTGARRRVCALRCDGTAVETVVDSRGHEIWWDPRLQRFTTAPTPLVCGEFR